MPFVTTEVLLVFDADYIPEHMLTKEFLEEVRAIMVPRGVIVANTFSDSALYDHESATYRAVFATFFNLKLANRIIVGRVGGLSADDLATARIHRDDLIGGGAASGVGDPARREQRCAGRRRLIVSKSRCVKTPRPRIAGPGSSVSVPRLRRSA